MIYYFYPSPLPLVTYVCLFTVMTDPFADHLVCLFTVMTDPLADHLVCLSAYYHGQIHLQTILYVCLSTIMTDLLADHLVIDFENLCLLFGYMYVVYGLIFFYKPDGFSYEKSFEICICL